jgi:hypothetical protein
MLSRLFRLSLVLLAVIAVLLVAFVLIPGLRHVEDPGLDPAYDASAVKPPPSRSRIPANPNKSAWFGDLHVHTSYSTDAFIFGVRALPDDAYHFAKGGTIAHGAGYPIGLSKPLDFLAVTDHAEFLGTARATEPDIPSVRRPLRDLLKTGNRLEVSAYWAESVSLIGGGGFGAFGAQPEAERAAWEDTIASANRHNNPGIFTAFIGYEWSSLGIHRNVVYGSERVPDRPYSSVDSDRPQDLWQALEVQVRADQPVIAIPHNMNESGGRMYPSESIEGLEWTEAEARRRRLIEPVSEIYQVKGSSEAHPTLSPNDPFADFEIIDLPAYRGTGGGPDGAYSRDALRTGLELAMSEGWNPYLLGVIGSTDSHNASSPVEENNHHGKLPVLDGSPALRSGELLLIPASETPGATWGGGGLAGIWAEENTRASLFAGLQRRETFATSGPRIQVRFFGGWNFLESDLQDPNILQRAYQLGVPMGGEMPPPIGGLAPSAPTFILWADKDPDTAHLDRIQVIKGGVRANGESYEKVYDVAASPGRTRDPQTGLFSAVENTVDIAEASYTNTVGAAHLEGTWTDPDFDPHHDSFYYVRVLEIPTPRLSTFDAKLLGIDAPSPATIQERAATSAIWYTAPR